MMLDAGALVVIALFGLSLYVMLVVSPRLAGGRDRTPWWRSATFWGCFVALAQIVVYALFS
jgi:hypothetical protein